jgi:hypothetical protein
MESTPSTALKRIKDEVPIVVVEVQEGRITTALQTQGSKSTRAKARKDDKITTNSDANSSKSEQKILEILRKSVQPFSDRLDPFAALPISLNRFQEHLVTFYLLYYPRVTYGFSPRLRPHPVASNFSIALTTPACFQVALARSALYRLSLHKYASDAEKRALELAMMQHKGKALSLIRELSTKQSATRKDDLLASMISIGNLDRRNGARQSCETHYVAIRKLLKSTGGPLAVKSVLLSRVMCFFECIYGTSPESYIWDETDLTPLLGRLNGSLLKLWELWKSLSNISGVVERTADFEHECECPPIHSFGVQPGSTLLSLLERQAPEGAEMTEPRRLEMVFQVTCLLTLAMVVLDHATDFRVLQRHMDDLHQTMDDLKLAGQSCNNAMWQIQVNDHTEAHSRRIWQAASYAWVMKHVSYNVQKTLKDWLLSFFKGRPAEKVFRLDAFHFSYAN